MSTAELLRVLTGIAVLVAAAAVVLRVYRVRRPWAPASAVARGALQLAAISLVLTGVITSRLWVTAALLVMFSVAATTATRRLGWSTERAVQVVVAMAAGVLLALAVVFVTGAIGFTARYTLAIGGIVVGNAMTVATLTGRRFTQATIDHWEEVEGWLALGARPAQSTAQIARDAVYSAMIPTTDQTKTTGLVTLPGAFVGAIFGGVSPLEAGRFQIVVLAAIMAAGSLTAVLLARWLQPIRSRPEALR